MLERLMDTDRQTPPSSAPAGSPHSNGRFAAERDLRDMRSLYHKYFGDRRKERQLFSAGSFFVTFAAVRGITHCDQGRAGARSGTSPRAAGTSTT